MHINHQIYLIHLLVIKLIASLIAINQLVVLFVYSFFFDTS